MFCLHGLNPNPQPHHIETSQHIRYSHFPHFPYEVEAAFFSLFVLFHVFFFRENNHFFDFLLFAAFFLGKMENLSSF